MQLARSMPRKTALSILFIWAIGSFLVLAIPCPFELGVTGKGISGGSAGSEIPEDVLKCSTPDFAFDQEGDSPGLLFCTIQNCELPHHPAIFIHEPGGWRFLDMPEDYYEQSTWVYAGGTHDRRLIWGVTDVDVEDPGWDLEIVFSCDAGRSWKRIGEVNKPSYQAFFNSFAMGASGNGALAVHLDEDYTAMGRRRRAFKGYYSYFTRDWGRHWSRPRYSRRKPRALHQSLVEPAHLTSSETGSRIDELKALMARVEVGSRRSSRSKE